MSLVVTFLFTASGFLPKLYLDVKDGNFSQKQAHHRKKVEKPKKRKTFESFSENRNNYGKMSLTFLTFQRRGKFSRLNKIVQLRNNLQCIFRVSFNFFCAASFLKGLNFEEHFKLLTNVITNDECFVKRFELKLL